MIRNKLTHRTCSPALLHHKINSISSKCGHTIATKVVCDSGCVGLFIGERSAPCSPRQADAYYKQKKRKKEASRNYPLKGRPDESYGFWDNCRHLDGRELSAQKLAA